MTANKQPQAEAVPELTGCNCRWRGDEVVSRCELHEAWKVAIHEWAARAKTAEAKQAKAVPHLFDPKHMLAVFDKARHGSTGPAGFARGIVAVISEWEAGRGQAEAVPPGYVLVPVEPTEAMHQAAVKAIVRCTGNDDFPPAVWGAMIAAASRGAKP